jgi:3-hydroxyisobutyrate dehydrogenase-like beta-hydroxyacid dehydrogenase
MCDTPVTTEFTLGEFKERRTGETLMRAIGFIGLGIMGQPMVQNLMKAGFQVVVWNRTISKSEEMAKLGVEIGASPADLARHTDAVISCVTDSPDVEEIVLGSDGVFSGARPGLVMIDMSTISPDVTREISMKLAEKDVSMLDAPVSGGQWGAVNGTLSIMVGGPQPTFQRCEQIFKAMGERIIYCGSSGMGQVTKSVNQIIVAGTMAAVSEGLIFAAKAGADLASVYEAVSGGAAQSWQLDNLGARILDGDFDPGFMLKLQQKDLQIVLDAAQKMKLPLFTTPIINQFYRALELSGEGQSGTQAYIKILETLSGVEARISQQDDNL